MSCKCLLRAYCFEGAVLASKAARAFEGYARDDTFQARGRWLLAKRALDRHVSHGLRIKARGDQIRAREKLIRRRSS